MREFLIWFLQTVIALLLAWALSWLSGFVPVIPFKLLVLQVVLGLAAWFLAGLLLGWVVKSANQPAHA